MPAVDFGRSEEVCRASGNCMWDVVGERTIVAATEPLVREHKRVFPGKRNARCDEERNKAFPRKEFAAQSRSMRIHAFHGATGLPKKGGG